MNEPGSIPVLTVHGMGLAHAWENSMLELWQHGCEIPTQYDKPGDPLSKDCTMMIVVHDPTLEPCIHRAFPGGLDALEEYRLEVVDGIKDHWVRDPNDPDDHRWEYTYHDRLRRFKGAALVKRTLKVDSSSVFNLEAIEIDQIEDIATQLAQCPHTRRANAVIWNPVTDTGISDPPCLQSIWCRILPDSNGTLRLNMNVRFRSRDAYDAAFMNMWALISLMKTIALKVEMRLAERVLLGRYVDISDSYHIYGRRIGHFRDGFLKLVNERSFEDRTWTLEFAAEHFAEARRLIREKVKTYDERKKS